VITHFRLGPGAIRSVGVSVHRQLESNPGLGIDALLWDGCRVQAREHLDDLAQRLCPSATFADLVLPPAQLDTLAEIVAHVRRRTRVWETWGFGRSSSRGLGVSAVFAGLSGTGKALSAEVLAHTLELDLYRVDLSQVVDKYIGETEKICGAFSTPRSRAARCSCSTRPTLSSASAARFETATIAMPTSR